MSEPTIVADGLRRRFGDNEAVQGVDLEVAPGEIFGFLGPNGAGKTTIVRMLCTLLAPTSGTGRVAGFDVVDQPEEVRLRIGVALQEAALDPKQRGDELLRLQARLYGLTRAEADQRIHEITDMVDLGDALGHFIGTYSGGMRRRIDLATALVHNPQVLFLDEPTTGLDPVSRQKVWEEVRRLNTELDVTIFLTTQYLEEADVLADRVGIIDKGLLVALGTPDELKRRIGSDVIVVTVEGDPEEARRVVGDVEAVTEVDVHGDELTVSVEDGAAAISPVAVALNGCSVKVRDLTLRTPTLDDVFLELTGNRIRVGAEEGADQEEAA